MWPKEMARIGKFLGKIHVAIVATNQARQDNVPQRLQSTLTLARLAFSFQEEGGPFFLFNKLRNPQTR